MVKYQTKKGWIRYRTVQTVKWRENRPIKSINARVLQSLLKESYQKNGGHFLQSAALYVGFFSVSFHYDYRRQKRGNSRCC